MPRIGFLTMALLKAPRSDASVAGFISRVDKNFAAAETAPGFIDRARLDEETGLYNWGTRGIPSSFPYREVGDRIVQTLSVWNDLESVAAYAYTETHAEALAGRREWCVRATWPSYVAWWINDDARPSWSESYLRFDLLHLQGPGGEAFDFKRPYAIDGSPTTLARINLPRPS
jgi:hypothetical protein